MIESDPSEYPGGMEKGYEQENGHENTSMISPFELADRDIHWQSIP